MTTGAVEVVGFKNLGVGVRGVYDGKLKLKRLFTPSLLGYIFTTNFVYDNVS